MTALAHKIFGSYTCQGGGSYRYWGKCTSELPIEYEVFVVLSTDQPHDVLRDYRFKLQGPLLNMTLDPEGIRSLATQEIERGLEESADMTCEGPLKRQS